MQTTKAKTVQLAPPGPIGLGIRVILGATVVYWFVALLTKWNGFLAHDPIESGRLYTLFTIWLLSDVVALTLRRPWGLWPAVVFVAGRGDRPGRLPDRRGVEPRAGGMDLRRRPAGLGRPGGFVPGRYPHPPRVRARRYRLAPGRPAGRGRAQAGLCRGPGPPRRLGGRKEKVNAKENLWLVESAPSSTRRWSRSASPSPQLCWRPPTPEAGAWCNPPACRAIGRDRFVGVVSWRRRLVTATLLNDEEAT